MESRANPAWSFCTSHCAGSEGRRKIVKFAQPFQPRVAPSPLPPSLAYPFSSSLRRSFYPVGFPPLGKIVWSIEGTILASAAAAAYLNVNDVLAQKRGKYLRLIAETLCGRNEGLYNS